MDLSRRSVTVAGLLNGRRPVQGLEGPISPLRRTVVLGALPVVVVGPRVVVVARPGLAVVEVELALGRVLVVVVEPPPTVPATR